MTALEVKQAHQALLDSVASLVDEFDDIPTGRVLRCFSRAVGCARREGCPTKWLPEEAERLAREMLVGRPAWEAGTVGPRRPTRAPSP